jgi:predicted GNAT family N-acyltransferase
VIVQFVSWEEAGSALADIRRKVFIEEQLVPKHLEWDGLDDSAVHVLALDDQRRAIGCARMLPDGRIGRMAVLPAWRGSGVGRAMLEVLLELARERKLQKVSLSAQTHAIPFYADAGFTICSDIYDDAGIPHRDMLLILSS